MTESTTTEYQDIVQALLNEDQLFSLQERRVNSRQKFVRPSRLICLSKPKDVLSAFTRDLSGTGIGLLHRFELEFGEHALITINRLWDEPVVLKGKLAWCKKSENGWYQSGWHIDSVESTGKSTS